MKIDDKVLFWVDSDDSGMASTLFGVDPQNDWYDIQYYPEQKRGIIIENKNTILVQHIYNDDDRGKVYDISKNGIKRRILGIETHLEIYGISVSDFTDGENSLSFFYDIQKL